MERSRKARWLVLAAGLAFLGGALNAEDSKTGKTRPVEARVVDTYGKRPLTFEANQGQTDPQVKFLARGDGYGLFLTPTEAVLSFEKPDTASRALHLRWLGANPAPRISGQEEQTGKVHYLKGKDPSGWRRNVPLYARVAYESVYPGIDLVFYGNQRQLEHDYVLAPGADPKKVRFAFQGADRVEIDRSGELVVRLGDEEVRLHRPIAYQDTKAGRGPIPVDYRLIATGGLGLPEVGFTVGIYDPGTALVIDPVIDYSSYLGGSWYEVMLSITVDPDGNAYLTGFTPSPEFPTTPGVFGIGPPGVFVTKIAPSGMLIYSSFLGGSALELAGGIAVDDQGNVYVSGSTDSSDFPEVNPLPFQGTSSDVFITKIDPSGSTLLFSTRFGGSGGDYGQGIAVDRTGSMYVFGTTSSSDFPKADTVHGTLQNSPLFVTKIAPDGASLVYSTFLGGSVLENLLDVAVDPAGHAYLAGKTWSPDFPTYQAVQSSLRGLYDGFVVKLHPTGSLIYSTYLGSSHIDEVTGVAADDSGNAYVTGYTWRGDFPEVNDLGPTPSVFPKGFVTKLSPTGELVYSTLLGGSHTETLLGIDVDASGAPTVVGYSHSVDYPLRDPVQAECWPRIGSYFCSSDAVVTTLNPQGSAITFSTFLGGTGSDFAQEVALDRQGNIYLVGNTTSRDLPTVNAFQPFFHEGEYDEAFVARIRFNHPPDCAASLASPNAIWPPQGKLVPISIEGVTDPDGDPVTVTITAIRQDEPLSRTGAPDAIGLGTPTAQVRADRKGGSDGRVYHLSFETRDDQGATCTGTVKVCVPHDQRPGTACGDGGPLFDSTR